MSDDAILGRHVPVLSDEKRLASWSPTLEVFEKTTSFSGGAILLPLEALPPGQFMLVFFRLLVVDIFKQFLKSPRRRSMVGRTFTGRDWDF